MDASMGYGAIANVAGGIMQSIAASQANRAMVNAFQKELKKQGGYRGQAFTDLGQYLPTLGVETARQQLGAGADTRMADYHTVQQTPLGFGEGPTARDRSYTDMLGANRAKLSAYGDWDTEQSLAGSRYVQGLRRVEDTARGELSVFPYDMYKAQHSMDELAFWGNLISSIGGSAGSWSSLFGTGPQGATMQPQQQPNYQLNDMNREGNLAIG